jgi:GntR family transcriptional regulator / MocR family aminotransferase
MDYQLLFDQYKAKHSGMKQSQQRSLYSCIREAILSGKLLPETILPGSRSLAAELAIARNSAIYAYEQLAMEGLLNTAGGRTSVAVVAPSFPRANHNEAQVESPAINLDSLPLSGRAQLMPWPVDPHGEFTAFMPGVPSLADFPLASWRRCIARAWKSMAHQQLDYSDTAGEPALRSAIADHLTRTRGVLCNASQIFITDGTHQSLALCAQAFADVGDCAWIENPGYGGAVQNFSAAELNVSGIAVDEQGIAPTQQEWEQDSPRLIYTTPSHQFPLGSVMSIERRIALIENAKKYNALIIEDDYDSEFRRNGPPLPAMQGLVENAPVIYLGTFSKTLFPALRIGFMVLPPSLVGAFSRFLTLGYLRGRSADQLALAEFIRAGHFANHLKKMRRLYAVRRDALVAAIQKYLGDTVTIYGGSSGIHLTVALPATLNDVVVGNAALKQGIYTQPLSKMAVGTVRNNGLMLGYAQVPEQDMDKYIRILADVIAHQ